MLKNVNVTELYSQFDDILNRFDRVLESSDRPDALNLRNNLRQESENIRKNPILRVAFIGQYSAGKSTIISALTGNRSIHIGADITTDKATPYSWNGIELIDTPGIGTDRADHDDVTYSEIDRSDLLVFCTTHMLLDDRIIGHFKKLAYDKHYSHKMMLVFNKLSAEAGDDDTRISNYRASMIKALHPHKLDDFTVCFFDAKDYCEGIDEDEPELIELSRFEEFIQALDQFIKERDKLAQLDTPIRRVLGYAENAEQWFVSQPQQDEMVNAALNRAAKTLRDGRSRFQLAVKRISLEVTEKVRAVGRNFADDLPEMKKADLPYRQKQVELELEEIWTELETELQRQTEDASEAVRDGVQEVLSSPFLSGFMPILDPDADFDASQLPPGFDFLRLQQQMQSLQEIGASAGVNVAKLATRSTLGTARSGGATLRTIDVAGSSLHRTVYSVGKFVGFKFKPFGAIKVAKNLGNAARFVGPLLGFLTIALEISDMAQQKKQADTAREAKAEIERQFTQIAKKVEQQIWQQRDQFIEETYDYIDLQIQTERRKFSDRQVANSQQAIEIQRLRADLDRLIVSLKP
jgi:hypothetical protein